MDQTLILEHDHKRRDAHENTESSTYEHSTDSDIQKTGDSKGIIINQVENEGSEPYGTKEKTGAFGDFRHQFKNTLPEYIKGPDTFTSVKTVEQKSWTVWPGPRSEEPLTRNPTTVEGILWSRKDNYCIN